MREAARDAQGQCWAEAGAAAGRSTGHNSGYYRGNFKYLMVCFTEIFHYDGSVKILRRSHHLCLGIL